MGFVMGFWIGVLLTLAVITASFGSLYDEGAIAVAQGIYECAEVKQFNKPAEWQCRKSGG